MKLPKKPKETVKVNILGNVNILEAIKDKNIKRFIFSSSVYVYSDAGLFYRSSKQACELYIENYSKVYGIEYTTLRYGSLYGPRSDDRNWLHKTLKQALLEKKIVREGDGEELREYIHVQDAARLSVDILDERFKNRCLIITGTEQMKIKDLLTMINEVLKNQIDIQYVPTKDKEHYEITPYTFKPQTASKIRSNEHFDMGQGIINMLSEIHAEYIAPNENVESKEKLQLS